MLDKSEKPCTLFQSSVLSASFSRLPTTLVKRSHFDKLPFYFPKIWYIFFWPTVHFSGHFLNEVVEFHHLFVDFMSVFLLNSTHCRKDKNDLLSEPYIWRTGKGRLLSDSFIMTPATEQGVWLESYQAQPLGNGPEATLLSCSVFGLGTGLGYDGKSCQLL